MAINQDFKDLFSILNDCRVEYLVIGAHAVMFYARPRFTKDLDIWVNPTKENAARVWKALDQFGAPLQDVTVGSFVDRQMIYQIGVEPNRIDIMMSTPGVEFDEAWKNRSKSRYGDVPIGIIGSTELVRTKKATGRPQDLLDAEELEKSK